MSQLQAPQSIDLKQNVQNPKNNIFCLIKTGMFRESKNLAANISTGLIELADSNTSFKYLEIRTLNHFSMRNIIWKNISIFKIVSYEEEIMCPPINTYMVPHS
ncbi:hypothetical protein HZS_5945 [Henneguya salminicola]|nr:hypothetical protein HZS_5945 [Henneguya salminicola]